MKIQGVGGKKRRTKAEGKEMRDIFRTEPELFRPTVKNIAQCMVHQVF